MWGVYGAHGFVFRLIDEALQSCNLYLLSGLVVYLFEHFSHILYIVSSQSVTDMRSTYRVPIGSCCL